jgi:hypothetical protein
MCNYIVRIYRFKKNNHRQLLGIVEEVGVNGRKAFSNLEELWEILNVSEKDSQKKHRDRKDAGLSPVGKPASKSDDKRRMSMSSPAKE